MQVPESRPVQGTPLISGMLGLAAVDVNPCAGEFGTRIGVHVVVKTSSSSPESHAAIGFESAACTWCATIATAGDTAIAKANPAARIKRRKAIGYVLMSCLSSSLTALGRILRTRKGFCWHSRRSRRTRCMNVWMLRRLRAGTHGGVRHRHGSLRLLLFAQADALTRIAAGARNVVDFGQSTG